MLRQFAKLIFVFVLFAPVVSADPITLSGSVTLVTGPLPSGVRTQPFVLTGLGFSANATAPGAGFGIRLCSTVSLDPPSPCTTASLSWQAVGTDLSGTFTLNGVTRGIDIVNQLGISFNSIVFTIPIELRDAPGVEVIAPFSFTGVAVTSDGLRADLTGEGTVTLLLLQRDLGDISGLFFERAVYTFGPVPQDVSIQAIPEPGTLVLLVSGLAGIGMFRKRSTRFKKR